MADEIISKRTLTSKTFYLGNQQYSEEIYSYPIHYLDENGQWQDVDTTINKFNAWEFSSAAVKNIYHAYFYDSTQSNMHLVSFEMVGQDNVARWVNMKLKNASPSSFESEESRCIFKDCFQNIDVEYVVIEDLLKENIILKDKTELREFVFTLKMGNIAVKDLGDGNIVFTNPDDDTVISVLDKPYMEDANGERSENITYSLGNDGEYQTLIVTVSDENYLTDAAYPVIIDPSIIVNDSTGAKTYGKSGNNDLYNQPTVWGVSDGFYGTQRSALYYDAFEEIKQAKANDTTGQMVVNNFYIDMYVTSSDRPYPGGVDIYTLSTPWPSGAPNFSGTKILNVPSSQAGTWVRVDLKNYINSNLNGIWFNPVSLYNKVWFASPFNSDTAIRPKLVMQWTYKPSLAFHDGNGTNNGMYADGNGNVFKYLDFGTLIASQNSLPQKVWLRNLSGFPVRDMSVTVPNPQVADKVIIEISASQSPFIPEPTLLYNGTLNDGDDATFYVRVLTFEGATVGGNFTITSKAYPV